MIQPEVKTVVGLQTVILKGGNRIECKNTLDGVNSVVFVGGTIYPQECSAESGGISYKGRVLFYCVYVADGDLKKCEFGMEFGGKLACTFPLPEQVNVKYRLENVSYDLRGSEISVRASVSAEAETLAKNEFSCVVGGGGIESKTAEAEYSKHYGLNRNVFTLEDEFDVNYPVKDVLYHFETVNLTGVQSGIGCIIFDGEISSSMTIMPLFENAEPVREKRLIPFRLELECADAMPTCSALCDAAIKLAAVKVLADEGKNKSSFQLTFGLELCGEAVIEEKTNYLEDAYSYTNEVELKRAETDAETFCGEFISTEKIIGAAACEIPENARIVATFGESFTFVSLVKDKGYVLEGTIKSTVLFRTVEKDYVAAIAEMPISVTVAEDEEIIGAVVTLTDFNARIRNGGMEFDCYLKICRKTYKKHKINYISDVVEGDKRAEKQAAISVYFPEKGDTLWDMAKSMGESPEKITELNPSLRFPTEGGERVLLYRRKTAEF